MEERASAKLIEVINITIRPMNKVSEAVINTENYNIDIAKDFIYIAYYNIHLNLILFSTTCFERSDDDGHDDVNYMHRRSVPHSHFHIIESKSLQDDNSNLPVIKCGTKIFIFKWVEQL